jgi:peptidoglycan/LPS O-acetylase OafA/YrhL
VGLLWLRDALPKWYGSARQNHWRRGVLVAAWGLALASLFYFNVSSDWDVWTWHYFGQFFLGVLVFHSTQCPRSRRLFWFYAAAVVTALIYDWRWRLAAALLTGLLLYFSSQSGLIARWPRSRIITYLGRTSYSLFLVHYPVLIFVEIVWTKMDWTSSRQAIFALFVAYAASLAVAAVFFEMVERPCARLVRDWRMLVAGAGKIDRSSG